MDSKPVSGGGEGSVIVGVGDVTGGLGVELGVGKVHPDKMMMTRMI
jgi:hypothetical protein